MIAGLQVAIAIFALLRSMACARLMGPHEYGSAAALVLVAAFLDAASETGVDRAVITSPLGGQSSFRATAQLVLLLRGLGCAALILVVLPSARNRLNLSGGTLAVALLAAISIAQSMHSLGLKVAQRSGVYGPEIACSLGSEVVGTFVAIIAAAHHFGANAILLGLLFRASTFAVLSQLGSTGRIRFTWNRIDRRQLAKHSIPYLMAATANFAAINLDKLLAAGLLGASELAKYSLAIAPVITAASICSRTIRVVFLPRLSNPKQSYNEALLFLKALTPLAALSAAILYGLAYPSFLKAFVGIHYVANLRVYWLLAVLLAFRVQRSGTNVRLLSSGEVWRLARVNTVRMCSALVIPLAFAFRPDLIGLATGSAVAEGLALAAAAFVVRRPTAPRVGGPVGRLN